MTRFIFIGRSSIDRDYDFSAGVTLLEVFQSLGHFRKLVSPVDDRGNFPGLHQVRENLQVGLIQIREEDSEFLVDKPGADNGVERAAEASQGLLMPPRTAESDHDADAIGSKNLSTLR